MDWRTKTVNTMAKQLVKKRIAVTFVRNGELVHAIPTLDEARQVAEGIQTLLDIANGDAPASLLSKPH